MSVLALCPSRGRPSAAHETLTSFLETRRDPGSRIVFVVDRDDPLARDYPREYTHIVPASSCMGDSLRAAQPEVIEDATVVGMIGDDNRFRTPGWDVIFRDYLEEHIGVAYGDDGYQHARLPTSWWVSRKLVDAFPLATRDHRHLYMDNWWRALGQGAGCLKYFPEVSIEHLHPIATEGTNWLHSGKADAIYQRGNSRVNARHDREAFERWQSRQMSADVARARAIVGGNDRRRILADWHHPALWESLSILFEDRFGWELVSMAGAEWVDHGWSLSTGPPISWSAADYLSLEDARRVGDHWETAVREYSRPRKMMTPSQALDMRWDYVLASVPEHQKSFSALADRLGARLIHQVGNAKHFIDPHVPQIVLASSTLPRRLRHPHVIYHQEFDRTVFAPAPITNHCTVTSLMLRLDWTSCDYRWLADAPGIGWRPVGGPDPRAPDYLAPMTKVADAMKASGWIWHDKRVGDGYGHVIHNAAAIGRPLIGHATHYAGLMGAPYWQDLKTCIDLDKHEPREALRLIRAISADPAWHTEMADNMVRQFDATVDFDAEAEVIRALLT